VIKRHHALKHATSTETDFVMVVGGPLTNGRFSVYSGANNAEPDYGFYDDQDTGMLRPGANALRFVTGGTAALDLDSSQNAIFAGTIAATGGNSTEWNTAYDDHIVSLAFSGTSTTTLTLTQQDGGTITNTFSNPQGDITNVNAGVGLSGGGGSGSITLTLDLNELTTSTANGDGDFFAVVDTVGAQKKLTKANIALSGMNNDSGWTSNTGDIEQVNTTSPIGGGGASGTVTITHDSQSDTQTLASETLAHDGTFTAYTSVTTNATGHVSAHTLKTYTLPSAGSYTLPTATLTTLGGVKLGSNTDQIVAGNTVSSTASRSYKVQLNSSDQMLVNVPWTDTDSGGTMSSWKIGSTTGTDQTVSNTQVVDIVGGTGISGVVGGTRTVTLTLDDTLVAPASYTNANITVDQQGRITTASNGSDAEGVTSITFTSDSGSTTAITSTGTIDIAGGTNVTTSATGSTVTINSTDQYTGTVTSVAALTLGTTGTDLSSTVAGGTGAAVITLQVPTASASNRGALSSADWTTFNNKGIGDITGITTAANSGLAGGVTSGTATLTLDVNNSTTSTLSTDADWFSIANTVGTTYKMAPGNIDLSTMNNDSGWTSSAGVVTTLTTTGTSGAATLVGATLNIPNYADDAGVTAVTATTPVVSSEGTTPDISMAAATTSVSGYLTTTDWNTFNNKGSGDGIVESLTTTGTSGASYLCKYKHTKHIHKFLGGLWD